MKTIELVVAELIQHGRDRCGAGFGNYPCGILYAVEQLMPLVDATVTQRNGYGEPGSTIAQALDAFKKRLDQ